MNASSQARTSAGPSNEKETTVTTTTQKEKVQQLNVKEGEPQEEEEETHQSAYRYKSPHVQRDTVTDVKQWCGEMRQLLEKEQEEEQNEAALGIQKYGAAQLEKAGAALTKLELVNVETGLFGRVVVTLQRQSTHGAASDSARDFPPNKFTTGDIAGLSFMNSSALGKTGQPDISGVITKIGPTSISIALDEKDDDPRECKKSNQATDDNRGLKVEDLVSTTKLRDGDEEATFRVDLLANDSTFSRLKAALNSLENGQHRDAGRIVDLMFQDATSSSFSKRIEDDLKDTPSADTGTSDLRKIKKFQPNRSLNESQEQAISRALRAPSLFMIHGPPGTGKTTTVVEFIRRAVALGNKVLACAPSNVAVDNMVERLGEYAKRDDNRLVRLGHPARVNQACWEYTLEAQMEASESMDILRDVKKDLQDTFKKMRTKKGLSPTDREELRSERRSLRKEFRQRERRVFSDVIRSSDVVLSTLSGAGSNALLKALNINSDIRTTGTSSAEQPRRLFDIVVIDEVAQSTEVACWIAMLLGRKCVVAGDHLQLPPTIKSSQAEHQGLGTTLADRMVARLKDFEDRYFSMLCVQYRMNERINNWSSTVFYDDKLIPAESVRHHTLSLNASGNPHPDIYASIPQLSMSTEEISDPLRLIDTSGCGDDYEEVMDSDLSTETRVSFGAESKANKGEADIVLKYVVMLLVHGIESSKIGVITPYNAQVRLIRERFLQNDINVTVNSVDGFQGQEKEVIVLSFVRSNRFREIGFLKDYRRTNVAITRARRHLCIIGNSETLRGDKFYTYLLSYCEEYGDFRTASEFSQQDSVATEAANGINKYDEQTKSTVTGPKKIQLIPAANVEEPPSSSRNENQESLLSKPLKGSSDSVDWKSATKKESRPRRLDYPTMQRYIKTVVGGHLKAIDAAMKKYEISLGEFGEMPVESSTSSISLHAIGANSRLAIVQQVLQNMHKNVINSIAQSKFPELSNEQFKRMKQKVATANPELVVVDFKDSGGGLLVAARYKDLDPLLRKHLYEYARNEGKFCFKQTLTATSKNVILTFRENADVSVPLDTSQSYVHFSEALTSDDEDSIDDVTNDVSELTPGKSVGADGSGDKTPCSNSTVSVETKPPPQNSLLKQLAEERRKRHEETKSRTAESTNGKKNTVDTQWIPESMLKDASKTSNRGNKQSKKKGNDHNATQKSKQEKRSSNIVGIEDIHVSDEQLKSFDGDEELAYLDSLAKQNQAKCNFRSCKERTTTVSSLCQHCHLKFCIKHGLPESHGCGEAARSSARSKTNREGAGASSTPLDVRRRQMASRELHKRISEAQEQRMPKAKESSETERTGSAVASSSSSKKGKKSGRKRK